ADFAAAPVDREIRTFERAVQAVAIVQMDPETFAVVLPGFELPGDRGNPVGGDSERGASLVQCQVGVTETAADQIVPRKKEHFSPGQSFGNFFEIEPGFDGAG